MTTDVAPPLHTGAVALEEAEALRPGWPDRREEKQP
jgi:hypothetical protein